MILTKDELITYIKSLDIQKTLAVYDNKRNFLFGVYYADEWLLMFDEFFNVKLSDTDDVNVHFNILNIDNFICIELYNIRELRFIVRQEIQNKVIKSLANNTDHNLIDIINGNLLGRCIKLHNNESGIIVNVISSLSDYYYGIITKTGRFLYMSCVGIPNFIDEKDIDSDLRELRENYEKIVAIRLAHISNLKTMDVELIHY